MVVSDISVTVEPVAGGGFCTRVRFGAKFFPERRDKVWYPTRRELKQLAREGRTPMDEAVRRGELLLARLRAQAEQEADLARQIRRLT